MTYVDLYRALFTGYLSGEEYSRVLRMRGIYAPTFLDTVWSDPFPFKTEGGPFGMVLGEDNRPFKTREGGTVRLVDLLEEAEARARAIVSLPRNPDAPTIISFIGSLIRRI